MTRRWLIAAGAVVLVASCSGSDDTEQESASGTDRATTTLSTSTTPATATSTTTDAPTTVASSTAPSAPTTPDPTDPPRTVDITTESGRLQVGTGSLPDGLDAGFPLPDDLVVALSSESDDSVGFSGTTEQPLDIVFEFYLEQLPAAGFDITASDAPAGVFATLSFTGIDGAGDVLLGASPEGGGTEITVIVDR